VRARGRGVDLTAAPFDSYRKSIASPTKYDASQSLGAAMRAAGVELFSYPSARDRDGGTGVGVFEPSAFGIAKPKKLETWHCTATRDLVEIVKRDYFGREVYAFVRTEFLAEGSLPAPAI
jgi:hypothetical protein